MPPEPADASSEPAGASSEPGAGGAPPVEVIDYTDPLCVWSWATEPNIRRLQVEYGDPILLAYRMGGLLESWDGFYDALHNIARPHPVPVSRPSPTACSWKSQHAEDGNGEREHAA